MGKKIQIIICLVLAGLGLWSIYKLYEMLKLQFQDVLFLGLLVICIETCVIISIVTSYENIQTINGGNDLIQTAYIRKSIWLKSYIIWLVVHYWMAASSILATSITIYITSGEEINKNKIIFYSIISLFVSIMSYVLNPKRISSGYRNAYQEIDTALLKFDNSDFEMLSEALIKGEEHIKTYSFD